MSRTTTLTAAPTDAAATDATAPVAGATPPAAGVSAAAVTDLLVGVYRDALGAPDLDEQSDFYENGGDSLTAFQVTARLQDALGVDVPVSLVFAYPTPADLADVVHSDLIEG
ncbi:acyl carrier protein [Streptomyces fradiae]|uniref:acyl carrier protein n=1 Tax=Streptomyces fradiae TaxID=1906 RepID=UPI002943BFA1|nr:acyl carrier protein [Streptomyces fradiae]WOI61157.1 acyl carrier protein [Streptomyces fradiae]